MPIEALKNRLPAFAKDASSTSRRCCRTKPCRQQRYGLFLACAIATRNADVIRAFETLAREGI